MPGITFPTSSIHDYAAKQYCLSKAGGRWAVHEIFLRDHQWADEIVALETEFMIQTNTKYTDLDKSRLLRGFMKFVSRISAYAKWLIVAPSFLNRTIKPSKAPIISVGAGGKVSRDTVPYLGSAVKSLPDLLEESADSPYASMQPPQLWKIHPLIIQDPFMYTHVSCFARCCDQTLNWVFRTMQSSSPFRPSMRLHVTPKLRSER